ncbi:Uncharacterised protein [Actinomadura madurae]|nr:Uncharacterised protein [Actinomadura madurae]
MDKTVRTVQKPVADIPSGAKFAVGGFGVCGIPLARSPNSEIWRSGRTTAEWTGQDSGSRSNTG